MIYRTVDIKLSGMEGKVFDSQEYAKLDIYAPDSYDEIPGCRIRPVVLICPGGAYGWTSKREGEPVAFQFLSRGIAAAVLWYSVRPAVFPTALLEVAASVKYLRENAAELKLDMNKIIVAGFSAGGHLAASYGCFWNKRFVRDMLGLEDKHAAWLKPNGLILSYPVITAGGKAHRGSIENLMGERREALCSRAMKELTGKDSPSYEDAIGVFSLEKHVSEDVPRTFLWHTATDEAVPVENSLYFVDALMKANINYELHIYPVGGHGISLGNELTRGGGEDSIRQIVPEVAGWIELAARWVGLSPKH